MEPEAMPPQWALDMAAKAAGLPDWLSADRIASLIERSSIIAHARTLAKYEKPPVDEAELKRRQDAREAVIYRQSFYGWKDAEAANKWAMQPAGLPLTETAYIALCREHGVTPTPVAEWERS